MAGMQSSRAMNWSGKKQGSVIYSADKENKVGAMFIIISLEKGDIPSFQDILRERLLTQGNYNMYLKVLLNSVLLTGYGQNMTWRVMGRLLNTWTF